MVDPQKIPPEKQLEIINRVKNRVKKHPVVVEMFKEYDVDPEEIDLVPMCFAELPVSARTDHGIIYFNFKLLEDGNFEDDDHYIVHELTHYLQQTTGSRPTKGSDAGSYLDNKEEIEGFQNQTEYLAETRDDDTAEQYVDQVLDHHEVSDKKERNKRKKQLLQLASIK